MNREFLPLVIAILTGFAIMGISRLILGTYKIEFVLIGGGMMIGSIIWFLIVNRERYNKCAQCGKRIPDDRFGDLHCKSCFEFRKKLKKRGWIQ